MIAPQRPLPDRFLFGAMLVLLIWLPIPWGSHRTWATDLFATAVFTLLALRLLAIAAGAVPLSPGTGQKLLAPVLWWLLWLGWIGAQLLPVDMALLARLSPESARLYAGAAGLLENPPTPHISIAPSATADALLLSAGYFALYALVVLSCAGDLARMSRVLVVLALSGLLQATYGCLMVLSGIEWGFFAEKAYYRGVATGTFVNRNHLAGYVNLTSAAALGLVLAEIGSAASRRTLRQRVLDFIAMIFSTKVRARVVLVVMVVALVLTRSRMGNIAFFASFCLCTMGFIVLRHRRYTVRALLLFASVIAVDILIVSNWYGLERVVERIEDTDLAEEGRSIFLGDVPPALDAYRTTGAGLGSFADAFAPYRSERLREHFDHAHNDYVEFMVETGIVGAGLLAVFVLAHAAHALAIVVRRRRRLAAAVGFSAIMAMTATAIHATAEFNLQIPANAATLLVLLALAVSCSSTSEQPQRPGALADPDVTPR